MKIYRGPKSKDFGDDSHELTDTKDLSHDTERWTVRKIVETNITKDGIERQAVTNIVLEEGDVVALYQGLIKGWQEKIGAFDALTKEALERKQALDQIYRIARLRNPKEADAEVITKIMSIAESVLKEKKK